MKKALVVDDARAIRTIVSCALVGLGFEVIQAADGREAVRVMEQDGGSFDLILLDWNMPQMNGLDVVHWVRAHPEFQAVRLMMVTTEVEIEQVVRALDAGANEYLMKPFTKEALEDKLRLLEVVA